jgi:hypothetical protein
MAKLEELVLQITADHQQLIAKLDETQKATNAVFQKMEKAVDQFSQQGQASTSRLAKVFDVFAGVTLANVASTIASSVLGAFGSLKSAIADGISEAMEYEKQNQRLANSLALSGNYSQEAMKDLQDFTSAMEEKIGVDDAAIAKNLALLSSLTRLDSEGLKRAQSAAADLSTALGVDLDTATNLVGKAINGNVEALARYGIKIKSTGDATKDGALALQEIEKRFGGAAAASQKGFGAALTKAQNAVGNLFQTIGSIITQNPVFVAIFDAVTNAVKKFTQFLEENSSTIQQIIATIIEFFLRFAQTVIEVFDFAGRGIRFFFDLFTKGWDEASNQLQRGETILGNVAKFFEKTADSVADSSYQIGKSSEVTVAAIENQKNVVRELSAEEQKRADKLKEFANSLIENARSETNLYSMRTEIFKTQYEADIINFETYKEAKLAAQAELMEQQRLMLEQANLSQQEYAIASAQLDRQQALERMKTMEELRKAEEADQKRRMQAFSGFFNNLAALQNTGSKELFAIGKAAALAQATIDGYAAIQGAYKTGAVIGGPPLGAAFAAAAAAATAVNIAKIAATGLRRGIDSVPGVGTQDNFPAMLAPGERVVPAKTNEDLTEFLSRMNNRETQQQIVFNLNFNGPVWADKATAGSEIIEAINEAIDRGMGLRLRQA